MFGALFPDGQRGEAYSESPTFHTLGSLFQTLPLSERPKHSTGLNQLNPCSR